MKWDSVLYEDRHAFVWEHAADLVTWLNPQPGERILDIGCGTGHLTGRIAETGADVVGIDSGPNMIGQARQNYPKLQFRLLDARALDYDGVFDAVFSNAALHWMPEADRVAAAMARALKPGGRFAAELGGHRNVGAIMDALEAALVRRGQPFEPGLYFPKLGEYSALLERHGIEVREARLFDRPTALEGPDGLKNWLLMFKQHVIPEALRPEILREVEDAVRPVLFRDGSWFADYRRLRLSGRKP